ncbi:MAG: DedA family protein [Myxococcaceae bacterium]|nr:DedA family protein [Myxococcaceae bacterium]
MLDALVLRWGYLAVGVGTMLEGETVLLAAGAMAHKGLLALPYVMLSAFAGGLANDLMWFTVGRHAGRAFITKRPRLAKHAAVVDRWIERSGTLFVLTFRFLPGVRTVGPILLGASSYSSARFMVLNALGAAVWSALVAFVGYGLGASIHALLGRATRPEEAALAALAVAVALWLFVSHREKVSPAAPGAKAELQAPET